LRSGPSLGSVASVIVMQGWLVEIHWDVLDQALAQYILASNDRTNDQSEEDNQQKEIHDSVSPNTSLSELRLLH